jgi:protein TonB
MARHPETIKVLLTLDPPSAASGGGGVPKEAAKKESPVQAPLRRHVIEKAQRREVRAITPTTERRTAKKEAIERSLPATTAQDTLLAESSSQQTIAASTAAPAVEQPDTRSPVNGTGGGGSGSGSGSGGGSGGGTGGGKGGFAGPGQGRGESTVTLKQRYVDAQFAYIKDLINKNITYPNMAKKLGWQGRVLVCFVVKENGKVDELRIEKSSGYEVLDRNVIETIQKVQPFPKPPVCAELTIPVSYALK